MAAMNTQQGYMQQHMQYRNLTPQQLRVMNQNRPQGKAEIDLKKGKILVEYGHIS